MLLIIENRIHHIFGKAAYHNQTRNTQILFSRGGLGSNRKPQLYSELFVFSWNVVRWKSCYFEINLKGALLLYVKKVFSVTLDQPLRTHIWTLKVDLRILESGWLVSIRYLKSDCKTVNTNWKTFELTIKFVKHMRSKLSACSICMQYA